MKLSEVNFPVYKIDKTPPSEDGGVLFYIKRSKVTGNTVLRIIDDKSIPGDTLSKRRVQLLLKAVAKEASLYPIKRCIYFVGDLIKEATPKQWFIDSSGKPFRYIKNRTVPLVYRKITNIIPVIGGVLIGVEGTEARFKALFPPADIHKFAALLQVSPRSYILYGYSELQYPNSVRKI